MSRVEQAIYTPVGVSAASLIKAEAPADAPGAPDLFNAELRAIEAAFTGLFAAPISAGDFLMSPSARNVIIDLAPLLNTGNYLVVTLPESPNVGDPSCVVMVQSSAYHTIGSVFESCVIVTTSDGTPINGLVPDNITYRNQIAIFNPGDIAKFTYIDPEQGWQVHSSLSVVGSTNTYTGVGAGTVPWPGQEVHANLAALMTFIPLAVYQAGESFVMSKHGAGNMAIGDATYTFNGVAGPYIISFNYERYRFTCRAAKNFIVVLP